MTKDDTLTIAEFQRMRAELDATLLKCISATLADFRRRTGLTPHSVIVEMVNVSTVGEPRQEHAVSAVGCHFDI
jgi:hypothetical protein